MTERARPAQPGRTGAAVVDRRLQRGARSRRTIVRHAVHVASEEGLAGLSLGRLATDLRLSKSGVQSLFGTKERLQVAAVEFAHDAFADAVVRPALTAPRGAARLRTLIERWIAYAEAPLFTGGCFWAANLADFDSRPGPVRDALFRHQQDWRDLLATELRQAAELGEIGELDTDLAAFQIDAVLVAANTALRLGEADAAGKVRRVVESFLTPAR
ncbi:TetR/AcrR family transcriptional regulator [Prauserella muralis]|uniref:Transcriptional regulator n=1 Tax=Prauserella muralis TaxID=588067 RepID=A0A2V4AN78_9PSEU|nr:TetR/AcrR family transcriptional regulator [Prauserella muralis]PXY22146.1 transcriptional regulator [Prauserella muralis]TWE27746.1 TetR family transcriptional regulator [Prauserella muralis]